MDLISSKFVPQKQVKSTLYRRLKKEALEELTLRYLSGDLPADSYIESANRINPPLDLRSFARRLRGRIWLSW